uniref:Uncharacterized protein n=1 Tax=Arundo donax TaxID=35708 RepID=A0A0A9GBL2_ARUDO
MHGVLACRPFFLDSLAQISPPPGPCSKNGGT